MNIKVLLHTIQLLSQYDNKKSPTSNEIFRVKHSPNIYQTSHSDNNCHGILGCFPIGPPWHGSLRQITLPPESINVIRPKICIHTTINPLCQELDYFNISSLRHRTMSQDSQILVITHGFLHSMHRNWIKELTMGILHNLPNNRTVILTLDWKLGARIPYAQASANTRIVGAFIGYILQRLSELYGIKLEKVHLIGHSLGAHLFGYAGSYLQQNYNATVNRITGMDPAGPYFRGTSNEVRLDKSDASLVVNIHTDSTPLVKWIFPYSLGIYEASGHIDFYPNGGIEQGICKDLSQNAMVDGPEGALKFMSCNHMQAIKYLLLSEIKSCFYIGVECSSWEKFKKGDCWNCSESRCYQMGIDVRQVLTHNHTYETKSIDVAEQSFNKTFIKAYLLIHQKDNSCEKQILVTLKVSKARSLASHKINIFITLRGDKGTSQLSVQKSLIYNNSLTVKWVDTVIDIGQLFSAVFRFNENQEPLNPMVAKDKRLVLKVEEMLINYLCSSETIIFKWHKNGLLAEENYTLERKIEERTP